MIIERHIVIAAPMEEVYRISQDYAVRYQWDLFPQRIQFLDGAKKIEIDTKVRVFAKSGLQMDMQFVQLDAPNRAAVVMINGPRVLEKFAGSWIFRRESTDKTRVTFRYLIRLKVWAIPVILGRLVAIYFSAVVKARMIGLKRYCEAS